MIAVLVESSRRGLNLYFRVSWRRRCLAFVFLKDSSCQLLRDARRSPARPNAKAYFIGLKDGATVPSRFTVPFGLENMDISQANTPSPYSGHHHLIIDSPLPSFDEPIPVDANHLHFGHGQTEAEIILQPGEHSLQLPLGDHDHVPHDPPVMSEAIHVRVDPATVENARQSSPLNVAVYFVNLEDGARIPTKFHVKFGAFDIGIAPAGERRPASGDHDLIIDAPLPELTQEIPADLNYLHFGRGQTEADLTLTPGPHTLQLLLGD
jgi:hypothetical protein